ncbi:MAG: hypothetical protein ABIG84_08290 [archaeon]
MEKSLVYFKDAVFESLARKWHEKVMTFTVFQDKKIRRLWHDGEWHYSVTDIIAVLTDSIDELAYWRKLKQREPQLVTICHGLKMPAKDGKLRYADCVNNKNAFRFFTQNHQNPTKNYNNTFRQYNTTYKLKNTKKSIQVQKWTRQAAYS